MSRSDRSLRLEVAVATLLGCLAILYLRKPDAFATPQFWGEDGALFFSEAREGGFSSIFELYNGYVHLAPRLIAFVSSALPPAHAPIAYNTAAIVMMLLSAAWCFSPRLGLSVPTAAACALAFVAVPHSGVVFANLTNVLNVLVLPLLLLTVAADAARTRERVVDFAILLGAGLTGPYVAALAPFFFVRALLRRTRWSLALFVLAFALGAIQVSRLGGSRTPGNLNLDDPSWSYAIGLRGAGVALFGWVEHAGLDTAIADWCPGLAWGSVALYVLVIVGAVLARRTFAVSAAAGSVVLHGLVAWAYRGNPFHLATEPVDRYSYPALVTLGWAVIALAGRGPRTIAWPARLVVLLMALSALDGFTSPAPRDLGWKKACETAFTTAMPARIAITPPGWFVAVSPLAEGRRVDGKLARSRLERTLGRPVDEIRPADATPTRLWTGDEWITGLPANAGCVFEVPLDVEVVEFDVWLIGAPSLPEAWTQLVVATVTDPENPDVVSVERVDLAPRTGIPGAERRVVRLPAVRTTTRLGVGAYGGVGTGGWFVAWRIAAMR